jgi:hypothetical protein
MIGVDIGVETGLDSAVEDIVVDDGGDDVDPELDVPEIGLDTELDIELGIVEISGVGDSTGAVVEACEAGVLLSIVVDSCVLGPPFDPEVVGSEVGVGGMVEAGRVVGGSPQMQMPHSVLVVGIVDPAVKHKHGVWHLNLWAATNHSASLHHAPNTNLRANHLGVKWWTKYTRIDDDGEQHTSFTSFYHSSS